MHSCVFTDRDRDKIAVSHMPCVLHFLSRHWPRNKKNTIFCISGDILILVADRTMFVSKWFASVVKLIPHIDGLVQERRNSSALAMELRLSCTNPSTCQRVQFYYCNNVPKYHIARDNFFGTFSCAVRSFINTRYSFQSKRWEWNIFEHQHVNNDNATAESLGTQLDELRQKLTWKCTQKSYIFLQFLWRSMIFCNLFSTIALHQILNVGRK